MTDFEADLRADALDEAEAHLLNASEGVDRFDDGVREQDSQEDHPRHPDPRCHECGERLADADRAEVFVTSAALDDRRGHFPFDAYPHPDTHEHGPVESGPFLVHADPCYLAHQDRYSLA